MATNETFPIDLDQFRPLALDPAVESLTAEQEQQLAANVQLCRDAIVFFTATGAARGVGGHTGGAYDIVPEVLLADGFMRGSYPVLQAYFDEAGHRVAIQYLLSVLNGHLPAAALMHYREAGAHLPGHPELGHTPGVGFSSGRLGHMWPHVNGVAMANPGKAVFCFSSDGSLQEGNDAEAARFAVGRNLNVKIIVDDNDVTIAGHPSTYLPGYSVSKTYAGHGLAVDEGDGEDLGRLYSTDGVGPPHRRSGGGRQPAPDGGGHPRARRNNQGPRRRLGRGRAGLPHPTGTPRGGRVPRHDHEDTEPPRLPRRRRTQGLQPQPLRARGGRDPGRDGRGDPQKPGFSSSTPTSRARAGWCTSRRPFPRSTSARASWSAATSPRRRASGWRPASRASSAPFSAFLEMCVSEITMARLNGCNVLCHFSHAGVDDMADNTCHFGLNNFFADNGLEHDDHPTRLYFPADGGQMRACVRRVFDDPGLRFVFSNRSKLPVILDADGRELFGDGYEFEPGRDEVVRDATPEGGFVVSFGDTLYRALDAVERLRADGVDVGLINKSTLNVVDEAMLEKIGVAPLGAGRREPQPANRPRNPIWNLAAAARLQSPLRPRRDESGRLGRALAADGASGA